VFLKVGAIAPFGSEFDGEGGEKSEGAKQHKGDENAQPLINH